MFLSSQHIHKTLNFHDKVLKLHGMALKKRYFHFRTMKQAIFFSFSLEEQCGVDRKYRVECGHYHITQKECERKHCCWSPLEENSKEPWCFFPGRAVNLGNYNHSFSVT